MLRWQKYVAVVLLCVIALLCVQRFAPDTWNQISSYVSAAAGPTATNTDPLSHDLEVETAPVVTMEGNIATISGTLTSISHKRYNEITMSVQFYDADGALIGEKSGEVIALALSPNAEKNYSFQCELSQSRYKTFEYSMRGWYNTIGI